MNAAIMNTFQQYLDLFMDTVAERHEINREELTEIWKETQKKKFKSEKKGKNKNKKSTVPSAYILFSKDERPKARKDNPEMDFTEMGRELGRRWRNATDTTKEHYKEKHDLLVKEKQNKIVDPPTSDVETTSGEEEEEIVVAEPVEPESEPEPEPEKKPKKPKKTKPKTVEIPEDITNERERDLWPEFAKMTITELRTQCDHNNIKKSKNRNDMIHALIVHRITLEDGNTQLESDDDDNDD